MGDQRPFASPFFRAEEKRSTGTKHSPIVNVVTIVSKITPYRECLRRLTRSTGYQSSYC